MSASPLADDVCPHCGAGVPAAARFCPECGTSLEDSTERTRVVELPPEETGPVPVSMQLAEPRWFGVTPPALLLGVATALFIVAVALFATGRWPYGLISLGVSALLVAAFLEAVRRRPQEHAATRAGRDVLERTTSLVEQWRARAGAAAEARRIQDGLLLVEAERTAALSQLGAAAYAHDGTAEAAARAALAELDERETALKERLAEQPALTEEKIRRAKLPVEDTMMVLPAEPGPPPGEATPPQPATVPEPYPPPDEGDPPEPARIPEPSPDQPRPEPTED